MAGTNGSNGNTLKGLDPALIRKLASSGRARNVYGPRLKDFIDSDEAAVDPSEAWPLEFSEKKAQTMYQSFRKAVKDAELTDTVVVRLHEDKVYLMHTERCAVVTAD
jgi:hypothetical protein